MSGSWRLHPSETALSNFCLQQKYKVSPEPARVSNEVLWLWQWQKKKKLWCLTVSFRHGLRWATQCTDSQEVSILSCLHYRNRTPLKVIPRLYMIQTGIKVLPLVHWGDLQLSSWSMVTDNPRKSHSHVTLLLQYSTITSYSIIFLLQPFWTTEPKLGNLSFKLRSKGYGLYCNTRTTYFMEKDNSYLFIQFIHFMTAKALNCKFCM